MTPYLGQTVVLYGGLDNSLSEHAAIVTFVHKKYTGTLVGQIGLVNLRVFLDGTPTDRVMKFVPLLESREGAISYNAMGAGYIAYIPTPEAPSYVPSIDSKDDGVPPLGGMAAVEVAQGAPIQ